MTLVRCALLLGLLAACSPTFAPPTRGAVASMPEVRSPGQVQLQLGYGSRNVVEGRAAIGLAPKLDLDLGTTMGGSDKGELFQMTGAGIRGQLLDLPKLKLSTCIGFGAGFGGQKDGDASKRFAVGGYVGLDFGVRASTMFGVYFANRYELSGAEGIPVTHWGLHTFGVEGNWTERLFSTLEGGAAWFWNTADTETGAMIYFSSGTRFGAGL